MNLEDLNKVNFYILIGSPNSRKSSVIKCLTGVGNVPKIYSKKKHKKYHIKTTSSELMDFHIETSALQEKPILPEKFIKTVEQILEETGCSNFLFPLRINGLKNTGVNYPDAQRYLNKFLAVNIKISKCELLGESEMLETLKEFNFINSIKCSVNTDDKKCNNEIATDIKNRWKWL